jgi:hypothetical protein
MCKIEDCVNTLKNGVSFIGIGKYMNKTWVYHIQRLGKVISMQLMAFVVFFLERFEWI